MLTEDQQSTINFVRRHDEKFHEENAVSDVFNEVVDDRRDREQLASRFSEEMAMYKSELLKY